MNYKHNLTSNYQIFFHQAGSCQMEGIVSLYNYIMTFLVGILFVVTTALVIIIITHLHGNRHITQFKTEQNIDELIEWQRFLHKWTHSTTLELVWTIIPTIILIAIAIPSFILLYSLDEIVDTQCVIKIIAYQWYWKYEYPVLNPINDEVYSFSYLSYMLPLEDLTEEDNLRLLEVDTPLVLPTSVNSKLVITSKDVIHSFAVPALGIKMDAIPGRLNQVTVHIFKSGVYYGQCSELCGVNHAFMPIAINAINFDTFEEFLADIYQTALKSRLFLPEAHLVFLLAAIDMYKAHLFFLLQIQDPILTADYFLSNNSMRNDLLGRFIVTYKAELNANTLLPGEIEFINTGILGFILESEKLLLQTLSEDHICHTLNLGELPTGEYLKSSDLVQYLTVQWENGFALHPKLYNLKTYLINMNKIDAIPLPLRLDQYYDLFNPYFFRKVWLELFVPTHVHLVDTHNEQLTALCYITDNNILEMQARLVDPTVDNAEVTKENYPFTDKEVEGQPNLCLTCFSRILEVDPTLGAIASTETTEIDASSSDSKPADSDEGSSSSSDSKPADSDEGSSSSSDSKSDDDDEGSSSSSDSKSDDDDSDSKPKPPAPIPAYPVISCDSDAVKLSGIWFEYEKMPPIST